MRLRIFAALGVAAVGGLAVVPARASTGVGGVPSLCAPVVTSVTAPDPQQQPEHNGPAGVTVTVQGSELGGLTCSLQYVQVGSVKIAPGQQNLNASSTGSSLAFTLPAGASGPVSVTVADVLGDAATSNANLVFLQTPSATLAAPTPVENSSEPLLGSGFAPFAAQARGGLPGASVTGVYEGCAAPNQRFAVSVESDTAASLPAPATYCDGSLVLAFQAPSDTSRPIDCTDQPASPAYNCIPIALTAGGVDVDFFVASASPVPYSMVPVGQVISVGGSGFGPSGSASITGHPAPASWSDTHISLTVPKGATSGEVVLQRASGDRAAVPLGIYLVEAPGSPVVPPSPGGGGSSGGGSSGGGSVGGVVGPTATPAGAAAAARAARGDGSTVAPSAGHDVVRLAVATTTAKPGSTVPFTVSVTLDGKPVSGAPVAMVLLASPGTDASVSPAVGATNAEGAFSGVIHLSRTAGRHLLLARSGLASDEVTVLGTAATASRAGGLPFGLGPLNVRVNGAPVIVWLSVATGLLLLLGLAVNLNVVRRVVWGTTARSLLRRLRGARAA